MSTAAGAKSVLPPARLFGPLLAIAVVAGLAVGLIWQGLLLAAAVHKLGYADFGPFLHTARALASGEPAYPLTTRVSLNPPHFHLLLAPVIHLADRWALGWYLFLSAASGAWGLVRLWRTLGHLSRPSRAGLACLALLSCATGAATITLQVTWILFGPLVAAWRAWRERQWLRGAVWFGLVLSVKPFLGLFLVWLLVQRRWSAAAASIGTAAGAAFAGIVAYGWPAYADWWAALSRVSWTTVRLNASFRGLFDRTLAANPSAAAVADMAFVAVLAAAVAGALVLAISFYALRRAPVDRAWAVLVLAALLVSPLGWLYYAWWAVPGLIGIRWRPRSIAGWIAVVILAWPQWDTRWGQPAAWATWTIASVYHWGLLTLWWALVSPGAQQPGSRRGL